ncbi:MAG: hypothetical protein JZU52_20200, partial [Lamprocystis purpurea]|nr:hypothetical protein [Lamprocystis purpurea]
MDGWKFGNDEQPVCHQNQWRQVRQDARVRGGRRDGFARIRESLPALALNHSVQYREYTESTVTMRFSVSFRRALIVVPVV